MGSRGTGKPGAGDGAGHTWLWQAAKVGLLMMPHLRVAQLRRKALRLQGSSARPASPHSGLSFHEFTNSSSLDAT